MIESHFLKKISQIDKKKLIFRDRDRAKTLPSALRRSRSKQVQKRVRFADSLGLDLEKREYFVKDDVHFR